MMPVALNKMSRWADAMGPFGSRTPSEQPPSIVAPIKTPIKTRASTADRMLDLLCPLWNLGRCRLGAAQFAMPRREPLPRSSTRSPNCQSIVPREIRIFNKRKPRIAWRDLLVFDLVVLTDCRDRGRRMTDRAAYPIKGRDDGLARRQDNRDNKNRCRRARAPLQRVPKTTSN